MRICDDSNDNTFQFLAYHSNRAPIKVTINKYATVACTVQIVYGQRMDMDRCIYPSREAYSDVVVVITNNVEH